MVTLTVTIEPYSENNMLQVSSKLFCYLPVLPVADLHFSLSLAKVANILCQLREMITSLGRRSRYLHRSVFGYLFPWVPSRGTYLVPFVTFRPKTQPTCGTVSEFIFSNSGDRLRSSHETTRLSPFVATVTFINTRSPRLLHSASTMVTPALSSGWLNSWKRFNTM